MNNKVTVIYAHPYTGSFDHAILESVTAELSAKNSEYEVIDLYQDNFDPVYSNEELRLFSSGIAVDPKVKAYQEKLKSSNVLIFIFPVWWYGLPAIVKGFIDKAMLNNFAYVDTNTGIKGLLSLDKCLTITTSKSPTWYLKYFGGNNIQKVFLNLTLKGVGVKQTKWVNFGSIKQSNAQTRKDFLQKIRQAVAKLL